MVLRKLNNRIIMACAINYFEKQENPQGDPRWQDG